MKYRLMDLLACPECGRFPLELTVLQSEPAVGNGACGCAVYCAANAEPVLREGSPAPCSGCYATEITEALLRCAGCGQEYPVIEGIPRFNPDVRSDYPEFFQKHAVQFRHAETADLNSFHALHTETKRSFGYQWLRYRVTDAVENRRIFHRRTATRPGTLGGQLFFEGGCGMGRYLKVIGQEPSAEVVGLDLSLAVNRARAENLDNPRVHVIQGNLLQLPLRRDTFDHVYSIGVLHHTPSTEEAFHSIAKLVKPGGRISVWIYDLWGPTTQRGFKRLHARIRGWISDTLRRITTRLPHSLLHYLCYIAVPLGWLQLRVRETRGLLRFLLSPLLFLPVSIHPEWRVRLCDTFDWYSPKFQWKHTIEEVSGWFEHAGLVDLSTDGFPVSVRGRRPAEQRQSLREAKATVTTATY